MYGNDVVRSQKTVWSKYLIADEHVNDMFSVEAVSVVSVSCVQETSGFAVWYSRNLRESDERGNPKLPNGDYLLDFYAANKSNEAIEAAVLAATCHEDPLKAVLRLDETALSSVKMKS